jgi:hypothetical protein
MHSSPRTLTRLGQLVLAGVLGARALLGQSFNEQVLQRLETAGKTLDYRAVQTRRVLSEAATPKQGASWVGALETVVHRGQRGNHAEGFSIELRGFEGMAMDPAELARRQVLYQGQAAYLFRYQGFRVLNARLATHNYVVQATVDSSTRAGRRCNRIAVISRTRDRSSWLLDLDAGNGFPLYCGEFTAAGQLVAEVVVSHIVYGSAAAIPEGDDWQWRPLKDISEHANTAQALARTRALAAVEVAATDLGVGYLFDHARVITDPLTADQALVQVFHDGLDALFIQQRTRPPLREQGNIARFYSEHGVHQCMFQHNRTEFLLVGRNTNLRAIAATLHRLAIAVL